MIIVLIECGHTCGIDRHKRKADRTLLFEYIYRNNIEPCSIKHLVINLVSVCCYL